MKVSYRHFRIPTIFARTLPKKGPPARGKLFEYHHSSGRFNYSRERKPFQRGGLTYCLLFNDDGVMIAHGKALCSLSDNFCYKTGRQISYERAMKQMEEATRTGE